MSLRGQYQVVCKHPYPCSHRQSVLSLRLSSNSQKPGDIKSLSCKSAGCCSGRRTTPIGLFSSIAIILLVLHKSGNYGILSAMYIYHDISTCIYVIYDMLLPLNQLILLRNETVGRPIYILECQCSFYHFLPFPWKVSFCTRILTRRWDKLIAIGNVYAYFSYFVDISLRFSLFFLVTHHGHLV